MALQCSCQLRGPGHSDLAKAAFDEAKGVFTKLLSQDPDKIRLVESVNDLDSFVALVKQREAAYKAKHHNGKARKWLSAASARIAHYGQIMDMLVQQAPEYASLAWGAMKLLFVGVENHEELLAEFSSCLHQVGAALPRIERNLILFPTPEVFSAAVHLYTSIIRFLVRALRWYDGTRSSHMRAAFLKPKKIMLDDILEDIHLQTAELDQWIFHWGLSEQRDMHLEQQSLAQKQEALILTGHQSQDMIKQIMQLVSAFPSEFASLHRGQGQIQGMVSEINDRVSDVQMKEILDACSSTLSFDFQETYRSCFILRNSRRRNGQYVAVHDRLRYRIQNFADLQHSSTIIIEGSVADLMVLRDLCTDLVEILQGACIPTIWIMDHRHSGSKRHFSPTDLLRSLTLQAIQVNASLHTEKSTSLKSAQMQSAATAAEWLAILGSALEGLKLLYIVVNTAAQIDDENEILPRERILWYDAFENLINDLKQRGSDVNLKVIFISQAMHQRKLCSSAAHVSPDSWVRLPRLSSETPKKRKKHLAQGRAGAFKIRRLENTSASA